MSATKSAGSARRSVLIVLGALLALTALVLAMVLGKSGDDDTVDGGFHELRKDEFAAALIDAREKAGSWSYIESHTLNGKPSGVLQGKVTWDGKNVGLAFVPQGSKNGEGEFRYVEGNWYYYAPGGDPKKPWLELDKSRSKVLTDALAREADPRRQLAIFKNPAGFQVLGVENVGVAVAVHYRVTVSIETVREVSSNPVVGNPGDKQVFDVWVDDKDQIVKMRIPTEITGISAEEIRTFTGYGNDVRIEVPPADQTRLGAVTTKQDTGAQPEVGTNH